MNFQQQTLYQTMNNFYPPSYSPLYQPPPQQPPPPPPQASYQLPYQQYSVQPVSHQFHSSPNQLINYQQQFIPQSSSASSAPQFQQQQQNQQNLMTTNPITPFYSNFDRGNLISIDNHQNNKQNMNLSKPAMKRRGSKVTNKM